jgi:hypothetical protein
MDPTKSRIEQNEETYLLVICGDDANRDGIGASVDQRRGRNVSVSGLLEVVQPIPPEVCERAD